ncbi:MAG TPA: MFS transporter [Xanthobacteraceae bacterium]|nr:MFS transporter [Xanthobacteraceae bacterium]
MTSAPEAKNYSGTELTSWYRELAPNEKRTFWACFGGWALDGMDVQILSFGIPAITAAFAINNADAGLIGTVTLLTSAFGGWTAGMLADRIGRVRTLQIAIVWFAFFTFLCGFAQDYVQLLVLRALMGLGYGGEWAAGAVLIGEVIRAQHRGKAVGSVQSGWAIGWGVAALMSMVFFTLLPQDMAWRALFWIGLLPAFFVFFVRRFVTDPPVFKVAQERIANGHPRASVLDIFSPAMIKTTILTSLLTTGAQGGYFALFTWLPTYLKVERNLSVIGTGGYIAIVILGSFVGYLVSAYLADRIGRRPNFILYAVSSVVTVIVYLLLPINDTMMLMLGFPLGFFASGIFSGMGPFLTENFPTRVRGSGQGFTYSFGRGGAALNPTFVGMLSATLPLGQSIAIFALGAYGLVVIAALLLPETRGRELTPDA